MSEQTLSLYSEVFLDHARKPRHLYAMQKSTHEAVGHNPMCGDKVHIFARVVAGQFEEISFLAEGCILCIGSASLLTEILRGRNIAELELEYLNLKNVLQSKKNKSEELASEGEQSWLKNLQAYQILQTYPTRQKCALLAWNTLMDAIKMPEHQNSELT